MILELLRKRRSIRLYEKRAVEQEKKDVITKAALLSPSSRGIRPWEFIIVEKKETLERLALSKASGSAFIKEAPLVIAVIADTVKSDVTIEDASIATVVIQLAAEDLGLGSCWIQIRNRKTGNGNSSEEYVRDVLKIPGNYQVEALIAIGYPAQTLEGYKDEELLYNKIHTEIY